MFDLGLYELHSLWLQKGIMIAINFAFLPDVASMVIDSSILDSRS